MYWFLDCWENAIVVTGAPREKQLTLHLWKEAGRLWPRFQAIQPQAELSMLRIRMRPGSDAWGAVGFAPGSVRTRNPRPGRKGFHAEHMLIITEGDAWDP